MLKEKKTESQEAEAPEGNRIYELCFHLAPTISEDDAAVQFSHLKSIIEKKNGAFISEEAPKLVSLAYELTKTIKAVKQHYNTAYFGWVKFEIEPAMLAEIEKEVKLFEPVLRYMLISTVRESTLAPIVPKESKDAKRGGAKGPEGELAPESTTDTSVPTVAAPAINEAEIDKSIDQLVQ